MAESIFVIAFTSFFKQVTPLLATITKLSEALEEVAARADILSASEATLRSQLAAAAESIASTTLQSEAAVADKFIAEAAVSEAQVRAIHLSSRESH